MIIGLTLMTASFLRSGKWEHAFQVGVIERLTTLVKLGVLQDAVPFSILAEMLSADVSCPCRPHLERDLGMRLARLPLRLRLKTYQ